MYSVLLASSLLVLLKSAECTNASFLDSVSGEIPAGNFSYLSLIHRGLVSLVLISHSGDCDIYVSQYETRPSFEHYSYCLQSSSCGVDTVIVPERFKRPLAVGIYGHPSHEISKCTLNIYQINDPSIEDDEPDELYIRTKYGSHGSPERSVEQQPNTSDYESLPFLMILFYYVYSVLQYFFDFSINAPLTPNELFELFLELLFL